MGWKYYSLAEGKAEDKGQAKPENKGQAKSPNKGQAKPEDKSEDKEKKRREFHSLDQIAQTLVLEARQRDRKSLNQSFKMREAVAYGLERFWGEHLRLQGRSKKNGDEFDCKGQYWKATWNALVSIMQPAGVTIPNDSVDVKNPKTVQAMAEKLWSISVEDQRIILAVLTQLCDAIVWWTQRYKGPGDLPNDEEN
jgi:hypothetical protein